MAQDGAPAAGEEGRYLDGAAGRDPVTNEVHAAVDLVEPLRSEATLDLPARHAHRQELTPRHNTELPPCQRSDPLVRSSSEWFGTHAVPNPALDLGAPVSAPAQYVSMTS